MLKVLIKKSQSNLVKKVLVVWEEGDNLGA
jgi:hypothetical protein